MSVLDLALNKAPYAVVGLETTGLVPRSDRVVEIAIVHDDNAGEPVVVLDSIVDPDRPMDGAEVHGLEVEMVRQAPKFEQLAPEVLAAIAGRVVVVHHAGTALRFLRDELGFAGFSDPFPHVCTMRVLSALGRPGTLSLPRAGEELGIETPGGHRAVEVARDVAALWRAERELLAGAGVHTLGALRARNPGRFVESLLFIPPLAPPRPERSAAVPRDVAALREAASPLTPRLRRYLHAVDAAMAYGRIADEDRDSLASLRAELGISEGEMRAVHARVLGSLLLRYSRDELVDEAERHDLEDLAAALHALGWAP